MKENIYGSKFDWIYVISPSTMQLFELDTDNYTNTFSLDWIFKNIERHHKECFDEKGKFLLTERINMLFVFDDMCNPIKKIINTDPRMKNLVMNRRHFFTDKDGKD